MRASLRKLDVAITPMLCTILLVELSEAAVWADGEPPHVDASGATFREIGWISGA